MTLIRKHYIAMALVTGVLSPAMPNARAATPYEACKVMTDKLATIYQILGHPKEFNTNPRMQANPVETAEQVVGLAYGTIKSEMDKKWDGFFDWSSITVLTALQSSQTAKQFRVDAFLKCMTKYE